MSAAQRIIVAIFAIVSFHLALCFSFPLRSKSLSSNSRVFVKPRSEEWAKERGMEPGVGGYWPGDPNAKTYKVTIRDKKTNQEYVQQVPEDRYIYFHYEDQEVELPIINRVRMCRQGCCTICTAKVVEGKVKMDAPLGLLKEFRSKGYALTCVAYPRSDLVLELQDEDEMYVRQWSEGFEGGGVQWGGFLPEDD